MRSERKTRLVIGAGETRELDRRISDGIDVRLLWHPHTGRRARGVPPSPTTTRTMRTAATPPPREREEQRES
jgi:hypothetical protein